jgi:hypothetical protein
MLQAALGAVFVICLARLSQVNLRSIRNKYVLSEEDLFLLRVVLVEAEVLRSKEKIAIMTC